MPSDYSWLGPEYPSDTYQVTIIRGPKNKKRVLRDLGGVRKELGPLTPSAAEDYVFDHMSATTYVGPPVVQVDKRGPALVLYEPYGLRALVKDGPLSTQSLVATFGTTIEYDTYVTIARHGKEVRSFDAGFKPPVKGALPEEAGLDWGAKGQNIWATAWTFLERVTKIHISQEWFELAHPTFVLKGR